MTLSVILNNKLTYSDHVTQNIRKALGRLTGMYRVRGLLPESAMLRLVQLLSILSFNTAIQHMVTVRQGRTLREF